MLHLAMVSVAPKKNDYSYAVGITQIAILGNNFSDMVKKSEKSTMVITPEVLMAVQPIESTAIPSDEKSSTNISVYRKPQSTTSPLESRMVKLKNIEHISESSAHEEQILQSEQQVISKSNKENTSDTTTKTNTKYASLETNSTSNTRISVDSRGDVSNEINHEESENYLKKVYMKIAKVRKPVIRASGKVIIGFEINAEGEITDIHIQQSSGKVRIDQAGISHVMRAAPFPIPPVNVRRNFIIPIEFRLFAR